MTNKEKQESLFVSPGATPVLFRSFVTGGALVIPVEDERMVIQTKYFLPDPRGAGSRRLGSILNVYVFHLLLQKKIVYIERIQKNNKKNPPEISSGS